MIVQAYGAPVDGLQFSDDGGTLVSYGAGGGGSDRSDAIGSLPGLSDLAPLTTRLPGGSPAKGKGRQPEQDIAFDRGIIPWTLEVYRANLMTRMQSASLSDPVRTALVAGTRTDQT